MAGSCSPSVSKNLHIRFDLNVFLGDLIVELRCSKNRQPKTIEKLLLGHVSEDDLTERLDLAWETLLFGRFLYEIGKPYLSRSLPEFWKGFHCLVYESPLPETFDLTWHHLLNICNDLIESRRRVRQIDDAKEQVDFLVVMFGNGLLPKGHWSAFFSVLFALLEGQPGSDLAPGELLLNPQVYSLLKPGDGIRGWKPESEYYSCLYHILHGLVRWARMRMAEWRARPRHPGYRREYGEAFPSERVIVDLMGWWEAGLKLLKGHFRPNLYDQ